MRKIVITTFSDKITAVTFEEGRPSLIDVYDKNDSDKEAALLGNVYIGRVQNVVKNINSAFVEIAKDVVCYYSLNDNTQHHFLNRKNTGKVCQGDLMLVQVSKEAIKTKAPSVSSQISITGNYIVMSLDDKGEVAVSAKIRDNHFRKNIQEKLKPYIEASDGRMSFVVRTAAYKADENELLKEAEYMSGLEHSIHIKSTSRPAFTCLYMKEEQYVSDIREYKLTNSDSIVSDEPELLENITSGVPRLKDITSLYEDKLLPLYKCYSLEKILHDALSPHVWLKSGAYLIIEPTEALTVIDVNTGKFDGNKKNREDTFLKINLEAAAEICRQLRLRNISGIIIVDFINMENPENNSSIIEFLKAELAKDSVPSFFIEMTKLGLVEITRKKIKKPLQEAFSHNFHKNYS